jgi:hypothetical protein
VHIDIICNENQPDAPFGVNLFSQSSSTCFGHVYGPSSGSIRCICTAIGMCYMFKLTGCWLGQDGTGWFYYKKLNNEIAGFFSKQHLVWLIFFLL